MNNKIITGYRRITVDSEIQRGPCLFYGLIVNAGSAGEITNIYSCPDANAMFLFHDFKNLVQYTSMLMLENPVYFDQGLYVELGANVDSVVVLYTPLET